MAVGNHRKHLFIVTKDQKLDYFVHSISIKHLFRSGPSRGAMEIRILPSHIGHIACPHRIDFALAADDATLVGISTFKRTVMYNTRFGVTSTGPELQHGKTGGTYVIPLRGSLYVLKRRFTVSDEGNPCGEDLLPANGFWRSLPEPPPDFRYLYEFQSDCQLTTYFTAGERIWISAKERGTYSFHTVRRAWRKEGDWELPFYHRALFVPELDNLCFGLCAKRRHLLAVDVLQSPPVVRYSWEETFPKWVKENGNLCGLMPEGSLVYLGAGKFCIAWTVLMDTIDRQRKIFIHFMTLQIIKTSTLSGNKQLRIVKCKVCCYKMPSHGLMAHVF
jgi:hypothetical protein